MAAEGNVEGVGEAVVLGDVVTSDYGGFAFAGGAVDLLVADGELFVGVALKRDAAEEIDAEANLEVGERAERGVVLGDGAVDQRCRVAGADLKSWSDAAEGALEVVIDVEGDAAGGETVGLVAGGCGKGAGDLVLEETRDELGVEAEDDIAGLAALVDEQSGGLGMGGGAFWERGKVNGGGGLWGGRGI